jgi:hypothetical protein
LPLATKTASSLYGPPTLLPSAVLIAALTLAANVGPAKVQHRSHGRVLAVGETVRLAHLHHPAWSSETTPPTAVQNAITQAAA